MQVQGSAKGQGRHVVDNRNQEADREAMISSIYDLTISSRNHRQDSSGQVRAGQLRTGRCRERSTKQSPRYIDSRKIR